MPIDCVVYKPHSSVNSTVMLVGSVCQHFLLVPSKALHVNEIYYSITYSNGMVHGSSMWGEVTVICEHHLWLSAEAAT